MRETPPGKVVEEVCAAEITHLWRAGERLIRRANRSNSGFCPNAAPPIDPGRWPPDALAGIAWQGVATQTGDPHSKESAPPSIGGLRNSVRRAVRAASIAATDTEDAPRLLPRKRYRRRALQTDACIPLPCLGHEGRCRRQRRAGKQFPHWAMTRRDRNAVEVGLLIAGKTEAVDCLFSGIEHLRAYL